MDVQDAHQRQPDKEEEEVDEEVVALDLEVHLAADEREPGPEFTQGVDHLVHERLFEVALRDAGAQAEEVEDVGVLRELLGELGVCGRKVLDEVRRGCTDALVRAGHDLV